MKLIKPPKKKRLIHAWRSYYNRGSGLYFQTCVSGRSYRDNAQDIYVCNRLGLKQYIGTFAIT